jgi:hypothetical protein
MPTFEGTLTKMQTEMGQPIQYYLIFDTNFLNVNQLINRTIQIQHKDINVYIVRKQKKFLDKVFVMIVFLPYLLLQIGS